MARRTQETPMDFAWQNGHGPVDNASPFVNLPGSQQQHNDSFAKKRTHGAFDSPSKPQFPSLRAPANQPFLFSQPFSEKPLPSVPAQFRTPAFATPRKLEQDLCSSGGETPNSPDNAADSEATPDMGLRNKFSSLLSRNKSDNSTGATGKAKRDSSHTKVVTSPGKGEIARGHYSTKGERIVKNRRAKANLQMARRRYNSVSDTEDDTRSNARRDVDTPESNGTAKATDALTRDSNTLATLFSFIETHPNLPHILSFYAQLLLNVFLVFFFIYIIYSFWSTIRSDVDKASEEAMAEALAEMTMCAQNYRENRCERETRVPAMEVVCANWEKCMNRDPRSVGRARVSAHTFAEIFNSFIEPISYKAMIFSLLLVFGCVAISNFAFGFFRNKAAVHHHMAQTYMHQPPPPTPQRFPSGAIMHDQGFYTPYQNRMQMLGGTEPAPSGLPPEESGRTSPVKQLAYL